MLASDLDTSACDADCGEHDKVEEAQLADETLAEADQEREGKRGDIDGDLGDSDGFSCGESHSGDNVA